MDIKALFKRIFIIYFSVFLVLSLSLSLINYRSVSAKIDRQIMESNQETLTHIDQSLQTILTNLDRNLLNLLSTDTMTQIINDNYSNKYDKFEKITLAQEEIGNFLRLNELAQGVYLYTEKSKSILTGDNYTAFDSFSDLSWYDAYRNMTTLSVLSDLYLIRRLPISYNEKQGAVILHLNEEALTRNIRNYQQNTSFYLLNSYGKIILGDPAMPLKLSGEEFSHDQIKYNGVKYIAFTQKSTALNWFLASAIPSDTVYFARNSNLKTLLLLTSSMIALAGIILLLLNRRSQKPILLIDDQLKHSVGSLKNQTVLNLLNETDRIDESVANLELLNIPLYNSFFIAIVIESDEAVPDDAIRHMDLIIKEHTRGILGQITPRRLAGILSFGNMDESDIFETAKVAAEYLRTMLTYEFNLNPQISIGGLAEDMSQIGRSYNQAVNSMKFYAVNENNEILCFEEIKNKTKIPYYEINSCIAEIRHEISENMFLTAKEKLEALFHMFMSQHLSIDHIHQFSLQLAGILASSAVDKGLSAENTPDWYNEIYSKNALDETHGLLLQLIDSMESHCAKAERSVANLLIQDATKYIDEHYTDENLSLSMLAELLNVSVSYLSRLFKQEINKTFLEYLIDCRIEQAKRLAVNTDMQISAISAAVGYKNYPSFVKTFKKQTGLSPGEYRKQHTGMPPFA